MLDTVLASDAPVDAAGLAAELGLHVTTARFHLEQLERAALVRRLVERAGSRGRPRVLFVPAPSARGEGAQRELTEVLAGALAEDDDGGRSRAIRAGETWAEQFRAELQAAEGAVKPLAALLDRLGFDPQPASPSNHEREPADDDEELAGEGARAAIDLHACPFRDEARRNPGVVCSVHLGLLRGAARTLGHNPDDAGLRPFVQPELCVVDLNGHWR